jgi:Tfp pilus assembly protein PilN
MNAVNLIPGDSRSGGRSRSTSRQTLALLAGLAMVLIAAVLYVSAANGVTASKGELARATANAASWRTVATELAPYVTASQQRTAQLAAVRQLAAGRFRWSHLLDQIAQLMPAAAELSSLQASSPAGGGATATQPGIQLAGCAASQSTVAQAMQQLRHIDGVSDVTLSSSSDNGTGPAATGSASSATTTSSGGGCTYPVQFQISLTFAAASTGAATPTSTHATAATSTSATAATSTTAAAQ